MKQIDEKLGKLISLVGHTAYDLGELDQPDIGFKNKMAARNREANNDLIKYISENYTKNE